MPRLAHGLRLPAACFALLFAATAAAQPAGNLTLDAFRPAIDARGYLTVNASAVLARGDVSFGLGSLDWGRHLLSLDGNGNTYSIDNMITATLIGAAGFQLGGLHLEAAASLPLRIVNGSRGPGTESHTFGLDGQGLGNLGIHLKARLLDARHHPVGLAVLASLYLPTIDPEDRFLGEDQWVPQVIAVVDQELGRRLRVALNGGVRLRRTTTFTNSDPGADMAPVTDRSITVGSELPFGLGAAYAIAPQRFELVAELFGAVPLGTHQRYQPLEALGGVKLYLARNSYLTLGAGRGLVTGEGGNPDVRAFIAIVFEPSLGEADGDVVADVPEPAREPGDLVNDRDGDGIRDEVDRCPDDPEDKDGFEDDDGCPDPDNDGDKILDVDDLCPDQPEDKDGFEDDDGCPDPDNDHDKIPDRDDKCPNEPETYNNFQDDDGCPDHGVTERDGGVLTILKPINFEYDRAIIKRDSYDILDAVVAAMNGYDDIQLIEVQGHTDERGDDAYNLDLSERRAAAVVQYLVAHGVAASRLTSQGYGETQPKDPRHNEAAWTKNRRVEFVIVKQR